MDKIRVVLLCVSALTLAPHAFCDNQVNFRITIGVYGSDAPWEKSISDVWSRDRTWQFAEELKYIKPHFPHTLQGINSAVEYLQTENIAVVMGPYNRALQLATEDLRIPYFVTSQPDDLVSSNFTYYLLPQDDVVHLAVLDIIKVFGWKKVGIIYDSHQGLHMMGDVLEHSKNVISVRSWRVSATDSQEHLKQTLINIREQGVTNSVLVCEAETMRRIFHMALQLSMMSSMYSWIPVTLNPDFEDLRNYSDTLVNLTTLELQSIESDVMLSKSLEYISAYDAHLLIVNASEKYISGEECETPICDISPSGFYQYLESIVREPPHGHLTFTKGNKRKFTSLSMLSLTSSGMTPIGVWSTEGNNSMSRLTIPWRNQTNAINSPNNNPFGRRVLKVVAIRDPPFVMYQEGHENKTGKAKFKGFLIDLIERLSKLKNFKYEIYEVPDGNYGKKLEDGTWNGMIRELIDGKADMCIGAISITSEREEVVDFTKPFMQKSYNLLIKKPKEKTSIFQFLWPLSKDVWLLTISSLVILGVILYLMDRISPNSKDKSHRFSLQESIWFIYGSLVGAGTEMVPRTLSGRLLSGSWWFFSLILISSYTANLAAFLTVTKINTPVNSLQDLVTQNVIKYGTVQNTNAHSFFMNSKLEIFRKMWSHIEISNGLVNDSRAGLQRVKNGDYAFIWDTPVNRYMTQNECDVMTVGEPFDQKGYGIGVPRGVSYRDDLTIGILTINEQGIMQELEERWWSGGRCDAFKETQTGRTKELNFLNVAGVFLVLALGACLAFVICFLELLYSKLHKKVKVLKRTPTANGDCEKDATELRASLCNQNISEIPTIKRGSKHRKSWLFR